LISDFQNVPTGIAVPVLSVCRVYASGVSCSGTAFGCTQSGGVCCALPTGFAFSVPFDSLFIDTQGQLYTGDECTVFVFVGFKSTTECVEPRFFE